MTTFALIGAAGFVAPRHMQAMKAVGGDLRAAFDPSDSVGIIDGFFPGADFFTEFERFERHIDKLRRNGKGVGFISICSPTYLHDSHCRLALHSAADAICEKPLVLNARNLDGLSTIEAQTGRKIWTILQLRLHPAIEALKSKVDASPDASYDVELTYVASRGRWYQVSWKGDESKSGGIAANIGIHLLDMLTYVFGPVERSVVHLRDQERAAGFLVCRRATVRWFLSIDCRDFPDGTPSNTATHRSITVNGEKLNFSNGFEGLHVLSYERILQGSGFGIAAARPGIELVSAVRTAPIKPGDGERHPSTVRYIPS